MPRTERRSRSIRSTWRDRHGRGIRSSVTRPPLPRLRTRRDVFDSTVAAAVEYLRDLWPDELATVHVRIAPAPRRADLEGVPRWATDPRTRTVTLYRIPMERLAQLHKDDEWHRRSYIESCVFRAVAELIGRDPWEIAPERYRHF